MLKFHHNKDLLIFYFTSTYFKSSGSGLLIVQFKPAEKWLEF